MSADTTLFMLQGMRRLSEQIQNQQSRKRTRDAEQQTHEIELALKRLKQLEEAVKHSDTDVSLFYELSKQHEGRPGYESVVKPFVTPQNGVNGTTPHGPGEHVHRLNSIMLQMRCDVFQDTINNLQVSLAQQEARVNANEAENVWREHARKDLERQLEEKTHTISELRAELKERSLTPPSQMTIATPSAVDRKNREEKLTRDLEQSRADLMKVLKQKRDLDAKLKKVTSELGGAHQHRMHQARELSIQALDAGHVAMCQAIEKQLETFGLEHEKINSLRLAIVPHAEAMRTALGQHLI